MNETARKGDMRLAYLVNLALAVYLVWSFFPIYWVLITSLKPDTMMLTSPPTFIFRPTVIHYVKLFQRGDFRLAFMNSVIVASAVTLISIIVGPLAAYSLARFKDSKIQFFAFVLLVVWMIPQVTVILPFFDIMRRIGLLGTRWSIILAHISFCMPLTIWLMISFFEDIPVELEESAMTDGCTSTEAFIRIAVPLALPGILTAAILAIITSWNEFMFAMILTSADSRTLPASVSKLIGKQAVDYGGLGASAIVMMVPVIVFAVLVQKRLVRGLTMGAVKG